VYKTKLVRGNSPHLFKREERMYWVEAIAWKSIDVLDEEFDQWEYGQHIDQRYVSRTGTYGTYLQGQGKIKEDYIERKRGGL
jgi:hypothetical protein